MKMYKARVVTIYERTSFIRQARSRRNDNNTSLAAQAVPFNNIINSSLSHMCNNFYRVNKQFYKHIADGGYLPLYAQHTYRQSREATMIQRIHMGIPYQRIWKNQR